MSAKLEGLKAGDRIRVTSEAVVVSAENGQLRASIDGDPYAIQFDARYVDAPTFRVEKLAVYPGPGAFITWGTRLNAWEVLAVRGENIILYREGSVLTRCLPDILDWEEVAK